MKRLTLILAGLMCLPMVGSSLVWGEGDPEAAVQGNGARGTAARGTLHGPEFDMAIGQIRERSR